MYTQKFSRYVIFVDDQLTAKIIVCENSQLVIFVVGL